MPNITVSVSDEVYRQARVRAAERGTSVSAIVRDHLNSLSEPDDGFARLEALQRDVLAELTDFRGGDRLDREAVHARAVR
jgi:plasmid stability protein